MDDHNLHLLSRYIDGDLSAADRTRVDEHLALCGDCRTALDELLALGERVRATAPVADRFAARRALHTILTSPSEPVWRRRIAVPAPILAVLVVALLAVASLLIARRTPAPAPQPPSDAAALDGRTPDLSRYDRGARLEVYVARRGAAGR